ncbi:UDP-3-O-(3-hydroxymyristoyl)glucosamine N-acyltransferase [Cecembia lonarensis]|uniref:UDP-3-O-[3-hydroxymyristoyl] glucosamine N-acyltransferase n=1 Tax=Cecembia lonarensis (strain CCUG 58316 / KCTC 22772 / LW9) TaxID=1225176 RepID=K1LA15_CECL9|nr:UDP-3-O-(3-hydroxymyristoyl)glucosamine N-acyltransferase [Cecembia lonarensis]EKB47238.1 UDP-3-O-[3-hydroxymyristoyl] glucosamine N-acyltransferase [Cecembia lonarensis LW9]
MLRNKVIMVGQGSIALEFAEYLEDYGRLFPSENINILGYLSLPGEEDRLADRFLDLGSPLLHQPSSDYLYMLGCEPNRYPDFILDLKKRGARFIRFVHPEAKLGSNVSLGEGVLIGPFAYVQSGAKLGDFNLLEMYSTVAMFAVVGNFNHLSPKAYVGPDCVLGTSNTIGLNANVPKGKSLGDQNRIPAGACV